jgi:hypothetical protein
VKQELTPMLLVYPCGNPAMATLVGMPGFKLYNSVY